MMNLDMCCVSCVSTVFAGIGQESFFEFRSTNPSRFSLVVDGSTNIPD
jgi:hypothetical protein